MKLSYKSSGVRPFIISPSVKYKKEATEIFRETDCKESTNEASESTFPPDSSVE